MKDLVRELRVGDRVEVRHWEFAKGWHPATVRSCSSHRHDGGERFRIVVVEVGTETDRTRLAGEGRYLGMSDDAVDARNIRRAKAAA